MNDIPYIDNDEMEISQYVKEKLQKLTDRKHIVYGFKNIKISMVSLKNSRVAVKLKNSKLLKSGIKDFKLELIKRYDSIYSSVARSKYFKLNDKKQQ
jgi:hypothetical protein